MEIIVAEKAGFCFGVERAVKKVYGAVEEENTPLYIVGDLIHNQQVMDFLKQKGLRCVESLDEVKEESRLVIRTHGQGPLFFSLVRQKKLKIIDATCPYVYRSQRCARNLAHKGFFVVIVGDRGHPEAEALLEWAGDSALIIEELKEIEEIPFYPKIGVVSQTTQRPSHFRAIAEALREKTSELAVYNTICKATEERQRAAYELSLRAEAMVVVGGKNSANTKKLAEVCRRENFPVYLVEDAGELNLEWLKGLRRVGITAGASTPYCIIEEVKRKMQEFTPEEEKEFTMEGEPIKEEGLEKESQTEGKELMERQEALAEPKDSTELSEETGEDTLNQQEMEEQMEEAMEALKRGNIVSGTVLRIEENEVMVDIGAKTEGVIPLSELSFRSFSNPHEVVSEGEVVEVQVIRVEDDQGRPVLSKKRAERRISWDKLEEALQNEEVIEAAVKEVVKGGILVDLGGINGFVPASQIDRGYVENLNEYVGQTLKLKVLEVDRTRNKAVLSRKKVLEEELEEKRNELWNNLKEGQTVKGIVKRLTDFGAFIDIGGYDGLLHVSELSWGRVEHPRDVLQEGDEIEVEILSFDREKGKISLGRKRFLANPWDTAVEKYPPGSIVEGKVLRLAPFGAFVEIEPGIEGLVHISQLAPYHVDKTEDAVQVGEVVKVKVLSVDQQSQRMSLSLKDAVMAEEEAENIKQEVENNVSNGAAVTIGELFGDILKEAKDNNFNS